MDISHQSRLDHSSAKTLLGVRMERWLKVAVLAAGCSCAVPMVAQTTWAVAGSGNWNLGTNWSSGVPNAATIADFSQATGYTITVNATASAAGLTFGSTGNYIITTTGGTNRVLSIGASGIYDNSIGDQIINGARLGLTLTAASTFTVASTGNLTISAGTTNGNIVTTATKELTLAGSSTGVGSISTVISGAGTLFKSGTGTWTLSGTNTYTGGTTVNSGTLGVASAAALGGATNALTLAGGTVDINTGTTVNAYNTTVTANSTVLSDLATAGAGLTYTLGTLNIGAQTLSIDRGTNVSANSAFGVTFGATTLTGGATFDVANNGTGIGTLTLGALNDGGTARTITKTDTGTLAFGATPGATVTSGASLVANGGIAQVNVAGALTSTNSYNITVNSTTASGTAAFNLNNVNQTIGTLTFGGIGAGASAVNSVATGTGLLTLGGGVTYDATNNPGGATLSGKLALGAATRTFNIGASSNATNELSVSAIVSGNAGIGVTKSGAGTLVFSGANTYTGKTSIQDGTLSVGSLNKVTGGTASSNLGTPSSVANGTIDFGSGATTGTLLYTGVGETTDRVVNLAGSTGGGTIDSSGSGALTFSSALTATAAGSKTLTLTGTNANANTFSGNIVNGSGTTAVAKSGAGMWTLSGTNTYTGGTTLNLGTLNLNSTTALGATASTFTINAGTLDNTSAGAITLANNNAQNWNGDFAFTGTKNLNLGTGAVTLGASRTVTANAGTLTVGGAISGAGFNLTKAGNGALTLNGNIGTTTGNVAANAGTLTLAGANTYTGGTTLASGATLNVNSTNALGATASALTINGGTLDNTSGGALTLANNNAQNWNGSFAFSGTQNLNLGTGAVTLGATPTVTVTGNTLTIGGAIGDGGNAYGLTKAGAGTLVFGGVNTQTGTTTLSAGTLTVNNLAALSSATAALVVNGGTLNLNNTAQTVASLNGSGGTINLGSTHTLTVNDSGTDSYSGVIASSGNLAKSGSGTLTLSGTNTFSGSTTVNAGTLVAGSNSALGAAAGTVTVNSGGTLGIAAGTTVTKSATLSLNGTGASGANGALVASGAPGTTSQFSGNLTLAGNTTIGAANNLLIVGEGSTFTNTINLLGSNTLTLNTTVAVDGSTPTPTFVPGGYTLDKAQIMVNSAISGTGGLIKTGPGTAMLIPANVNGSTFTGDTVITGGKLIVDGPINKPGIASNNIYVGNASSPGAANSVVLQMGQLATSPADSNMVGVWNNTTDSSASNLTIYADGVFNMNNASNGFTSLKLTGGHVNGNGITPLITLGNGGVTTNVLTTNASNQTAIIEGGRLGLATFGNSNFTVAAGTAPGGVDLRIDDVLQQGSLFTGYTDTNTSLTKLGAGKLVLTASNTYHGVTDVSAGILNIQNNAALGAVAPSLGNTANGTIVRSGAQLQLEKAAGLTIGSETLTLNGTGISNDGALRNVAGNNTYAGAITLASAASIKADTGSTLTLSGGITSTNVGLTVGGAGNVTESGTINLGTTGSLTKDDTGTLTFSGTTGNVGQVHLNGGTISVGSSSTLNTKEFDSAAGTTLTIATGGMVVANYTALTTTFAGTMAGGGTFEKDGAGILVFNYSFDAQAAGLSLVFGGGTIDLASGAQIKVGTIHITGNTILDFSNSTATLLQSTNLIIDYGVTVTVHNWASETDFWIASSSFSGLNGVTSTNVVTNTNNQPGTPQSQITFANWAGLDTAWIATPYPGYTNHEIRPIPEPATYGVLFLSGCLALVGWRRYSRRASARQG